MSNVSNKPANRTNTAKKKKQTMMKRTWQRLRKDKVAMFGLCGIIFLLLLAILAPVLTPYDYEAMDITCMRAAPSLAHPFGTDALGRDYLARLLYGGRYSLVLGIVGSIISLLIGITLGSLAGYFGGWLDNVIMRICDIIQAIPSMLFSILISMTFGGGYFLTVLALALSRCTNPIRMMRGQILSCRKAEYLEAAYMVNCSTPRILFRHALPNVFSPMLLNFTMGIATMIGTAASLSVIGLGVQPPTPEWGAMLSEGLSYFRSSPHLIFFPGLFVFATSLFINLFGDGLRDAMDPKLKH